MCHAMKRVIEALEIATASPHDLRRTGSTMMTSERLRVLPFIRSKVLSHRTDAGGGAAVSMLHYDMNEYVADKRQALSAWAELLLEIVGSAKSTGLTRLRLLVRLSMSRESAADFLPIMELGPVKSQIKAGTKKVRVNNFGKSAARRVTHLAPRPAAQDTSTVPWSWLVPVKKESEEGGDPDLMSVAMGLRETDPVPTIVREWLAMLTDSGRIKRKRGAGRRRDWLQRQFFGDWVRGLHAHHLDEVRAERKAAKAARKTARRKDIPPRQTKAPFDEALELTRESLAKEKEAMSVGQILDIVKRRGAWK